MNANGCLIFSLRITGEDRQKWKTEIQGYQTLDTSHIAYICDLHFNKNDLTKNGEHYRPKKNVLPQFR